MEETIEKKQAVGRIFSVCTIFYLVGCRDNVKACLRRDVSLTRSQYYSRRGQTVKKLTVHTQLADR